MLSVTGCGNEQYHTPICPESDSIPQHKTPHPTDPADVLRLPGCEAGGDDIGPPVAGAAEPIRPRSERPASLVGVAGIARQRLVVGGCNYVIIANGKIKL